MFDPAGASNKTVPRNNLHKFGHTKQQRSGDSSTAQRRVRHSIFTLKSSHWHFSLSSGMFYNLKIMFFYASFGKVMGMYHWF